MKAVILCAGKGERLRPLTEKLPKPLLPIANHPALEYLIRLCKYHGVEEIEINTSYLYEKIKKFIDKNNSFDIKINLSIENELLGTSGALNNFRDFLNEDSFFVIYGDNITNLNLSSMLEAHNRSNAFATIYVYHEKMADNKTTPGVILIDDNSFVKEIIENPNDLQKKRLENFDQNKKYTNAGIYIFKKEVLDLIPDGFSDFAKQILPEILNKKLKILAYKEDCYIREIGQISRYNKAKEEIESNQVKLIMDN